MLSQLPPWADAEEGSAPPPWAEAEGGSAHEHTADASTLSAQESTEDLNGTNLTTTIQLENSRESVSDVRDLNGTNLTTTIQVETRRESVSDVSNPSLPHSCPLAAPPTEPVSNASPASSATILAKTVPTGGPGAYTTTAAVHAKPVHRPLPGAYTGRLPLFDGRPAAHAAQRPSDLAGLGLSSVHVPDVILCLTGGSDVLQWDNTAEIYGLQFGLHAVPLTILNISPIVQDVWADLGVFPGDMLIETDGVDVTKSGTSHAVSMLEARPRELLFRAGRQQSANLRQSRHEVASLTRNQQQEFVSGMRARPKEVGSCMLRGAGQRRFDPACRGLQCEVGDTVFSPSAASHRSSSPHQGPPLNPMMRGAPYRPPHGQFDPTTAWSSAVGCRAHGQTEFAERGRRERLDTANPECPVHGRADYGEPQLPTVCVAGPSIQDRALSTSVDMMNRARRIADEADNVHKVDKFVSAIAESEEQAIMQEVEYYQEARLATLQTEAVAWAGRKAAIKSEAEEAMQKVASKKAILARRLHEERIRAAEEEKRAVAHGQVMERLDKLKSRKKGFERDLILKKLEDTERRAETAMKRYEVLLCQGPTPQFFDPSPERRRDQGKRVAASDAAENSTVCGSDRESVSSGGTLHPSPVATEIRQGARSSRPSSRSPQQKSSSSYRMVGHKGNAAGCKTGANATMCSPPSFDLDLSTLQQDFEAIDSKDNARGSTSPPPRIAPRANVPTICCRTDPVPQVGTRGWAAIPAPQPPLPPCLGGPCGLGRLAPSMNITGFDPFAGRGWRSVAPFGNTPIANPLVQMMPMPRPCCRSCGGPIPLGCQISTSQLCGNCLMLLQAHVVNANSTASMYAQQLHRQQQHAQMAPCVYIPEAPPPAAAAPPPAAAAPPPAAAAPPPAAAAPRVYITEPINVPSAQAAPMFPRTSSSEPVNVPTKPSVIVRPSFEALKGPVEGKSGKGKPSYGNLETFAVSGTASGLTFEPSAVGMSTVADVVPSLLDAWLPHGITIGSRLTHVDGHPVSDMAWSEVLHAARNLPVNLTFDVVKVAPTEITPAAGPQDTAVLTVPKQLATFSVSNGEDTGLELSQSPTGGIFVESLAPHLENVWKNRGIVPGCRLTHIGGQSVDGMNWAGIQPALNVSPVVLTLDLSRMEHLRDVKSTSPRFPRNVASSPTRAPEMITPPTFAPARTSQTRLVAPPEMIMPPTFAPARTSQTRPVAPPEMIMPPTFAPARTSTTRPVAQQLRQSTLSSVPPVLPRPYTESSVLATHSSVQTCVFETGDEGACLRWLKTASSDDVNGVDDLGKTILHWALLWRMEDAAKVILQHPEFNQEKAEDWLGNTAFDMAQDIDDEKTRSKFLALLSS